jgi:hypothetical protein
MVVELHHGMWQCVVKTDKLVDDEVKISRILCGCCGNRRKEQEDILDLVNEVGCDGALPRSM